MDRESLRALRRVADLPGLVALGFVLYALGIWALVVRGEVMPLGLLRILDVQRHLAAGLGPRDGVAAFGSSVLVEGLDCGAVAQGLPAGMPCQNLAWTGGNAKEWLLAVPALREAPPRVVVLGLDLPTLVSPGPFPPDRLAVAGYWRFLSDDELVADRAVLSAEELHVLEGARAMQLLRFRGLPLNTLNERVREVARSDLRYAGYATNFVAPWVRLAPSSEAALAVHLDQVGRMIRDGGLGKLRDTLGRVEFLVGRIRAAAPGARVLLVLTPVHPALVASAPPGALDAVRAEVAALAGRIGADARDDTLALDAAGFSDAVHPFGEGRTRWSLALGRGIAGLLGG